MHAWLNEARLRHTPRRHVDKEAYRTNNILQFIKVNLSSLHVDTF